MDFIILSVEISYLCSRKMDGHSKILAILKDWMLIIGMVAGAGIYLIYHAIPSLHGAGAVLESICKTIQPLLLFSMLFLSFCKISPKDLKPHRWQLWLLLIQSCSFVAMSIAIYWAMNSSSPLAELIVSKRFTIESVMLCMICPTATACAVVTDKLGGDMAQTVTYTILINLVVAIIVPLMVPLIYPTGGISFAAAFVKILKKVFPLLILPCLLAWGVRYFLPKLHARLLKWVGLSFYIWACALVLAILMSTRAIVHNPGSHLSLIGIAAGSLAACIFQFWCGKRIGRASGCEVTAGQSMGQKNTVFAIWMGYTFLDPLVSVAGGFYSIWHNVFNSWQLHKRRKELEEEAANSRADGGNQ